LLLVAQSACRADLDCFLALISGTEMCPHQYTRAISVLSDGVQPAMEMQETLFQRVKADAEDLQKLIRHGLNFAVRQYLDEASLEALCETFRMPPAEWTSEGLEQILIIRDGLYELRNRMRDKGDGSEHSLDLILSGLDRLYADLERFVLEASKDVAAARGHLARLRQTPNVSASSVDSNVEELKTAANELLTHTYITQRTIEITILRIGQLNINFEVLKNARLTVQRLSASVLSIRLSLQ
jgi:hypothetical protein